MSLPESSPLRPEQQQLAQQLGITGSSGMRSSQSLPSHSQTSELSCPFSSMPPNSTTRSRTSSYAIACPQRMPGCFVEATSMSSKRPITCGRTTSRSKEGGSAIVMDVQTGRLLVAASAPGFDLSLFTGASAEDWEQVQHDEQDIPVDQRHDRLRLQVEKSHQHHRADQRVHRFLGQLLLIEQAFHCCVEISVHFVPWFMF